MAEMVPVDGGSQFKKKDQPMRFKLLYRGSDNNFSASSFHKKCDSKGSTLTLLKSTKGRLFGGFTDIPWSSWGGWRKRNHKSFLFTINSCNGATTKLANKEGRNETYHDKEYLVCFGDTLSIYNQLNSRLDSIAQLGFVSNYVYPPHVVKGSRLDREFLFGEPACEIAEIEVF